MKNILIIGCGLIGSSVLRAAYAKKISSNIYVYEKSKRNISIIKKLKVRCKIVNKLNNISTNFDLIIICTPMSQYPNIITKINKYILNRTIVTDVGSTKESIFKEVRKLLNNNKSWVSSHPITG